MKPLDDTTYKQDFDDEPIETVVGDEKSADFEPRIKIKKWNNEANFSIGLDETSAAATVVDDEGVISFTKGSRTARFYETSEPTLAPLANIRRVLAGNELQVLEATAEYEMFNHIGQPGTLLLAHYVVPEPSLALFDLMPASLHLELGEDGKAKDFNYSDKLSYHPSDIPIKSLPDGVPIARYYTPITPVVNPMYMDEGLHNFDMQWHGTELTNVTDKILTAIESVLNPLGVETKRHDVRGKLYFRHGDRWVKFVSIQEELGGAYSYINFSSAYNKAYDFYKPNIPKDVRDEYAYGIQAAHPNIKHAVVNEIMHKFAELAGVPFIDKPYDDQEKQLWQSVQKLQDDYDWLADAKRKDANWHRRVPTDGYEFEVIFNQKPATNHVKLTANNPKNVKTYYQSELPIKQQLAEGIARQPHVQKSLAIYHVDQSLWGKGTVYKAGKVAHIYRPVAHDSSGYSVFCDFAELEGLIDGQEYDLSRGLTIIVPQEFLDKATYPVTVDPTFGYTTAGATQITMLDVIKGTVQTLPEDSYVISVTAYTGAVAGTTASYTLEMAAYNTSGNFLTDTAEVSGADIGAFTWRTQLIDGASYNLSSGDYILSAWGDSTAGAYGGALGIAYDSTAGKTSKTYSSNYVADTWPTGITFTNETNRQYSIYATYAKTYTYKFPIMVGSSVSRPAADRYSALMADNTAIKSATESLLQSTVPNQASYNNFKFQLGTAPGGSESETISLRGLTVSNQPSITISGAGTEASDTISWNTADSYASSSVINLFEDVSSVSIAVSALQKWRLDQWADNQHMYSASTANLSTTLARYMGIQDTSGLGTTAAAATQVLPEAGTFKTFRGRLNDTLTAGSYTATLVKNGVDTAVVLTFTDATLQSDTSNTVTVTTGDTIYWRMNPSTPTAPSNARAISIGCEYQSDVVGNGILLSGNNANASASATVYNTWYGCGAWNATEGNVTALAGAITVTKIQLLLSAQPGTGTPTKSRTITLRDDGADTAATVAISGTGGTTATWTGSVAVAEDSLICIAQTPANTPAASTVKYGIVFNAIPPSQFAQQIIML